MTYEEFIKFVQSKCMYETIYEDSEGRSILVIDLLDAYGMVNKASQPTGFIDSKLHPTERTWVGLTDDEYAKLAQEFGPFPINQIEAKLKEKNT